MRNGAFLLLILALLAGSGSPQEGKAPLYDEAADARRDISAATAEAGKATKNIVLIFGANW